MSKYQVWGPHFNYNGGFGKADKTAIYDPFSGTHETQIFEGKQQFGSDTPKEALRGLSSIQQRDMMVDSKNPAEILPPDELAIRQINMIPDFEPGMRSLLLPSDFEPSTQTGLIQKSRQNYITQSNKYDTVIPTGPQAIPGAQFNQIIGDSATGSFLDMLTTFATKVEFGRKGAAGTEEAEEEDDAANKATNTMNV